MRRVPWLLVILGVLAVAEIALLVWVADVIGVGWTLLALVGTAVLGGVLLRLEGRRAWASLREAQSAPEDVGRSMSDAAIVLVGGLLLLLPGFLSDLLGIICLVPVTRPLARRAIQGMLGAATRRYRDQVDLLDAKLHPDTVVRPDTDQKGPDDPTVIRGEILD